MMVLQIVPQLPPALEGVGGYAAALARGLARRRVASRFLVASRSWVGAEGLAGAPIVEHSARQLARQLAESGTRTVLVHYANYGYQVRGCPFWLVEGVSRWRAAAPERRLVSMFHEVYATGPPWRSSFWLSPVQRRLAARLMRVSDRAATSLELYARRLERWRSGEIVPVAPVLSAVGEPAMVPAPAERRPRVMVVFGSAGRRQHAYTEMRVALAAACRALEITEIVDLGPMIDPLPARIDGLQVHAFGPQPEEHASAILLRSYAGFIAYPAPFLAKSTVFAAYCAHGLIPVCAWHRKSGGKAGERPPCWEPGAEPAPADGAAIASRARAWYAGHDLAHQAAAFCDLLGGGLSDAGQKASHRRGREA